MVVFMETRNSDEGITNVLGTPIVFTMPSDDNVDEYSEVARAAQ
jgi:hypothetical protein